MSIVVNMEKPTICTDYCLGFLNFRNVMTERESVFYCEAEDPIWSKSKIELKFCRTISNTA